MGQLPKEGCLYCFSLRGSYRGNLDESFDLAEGYLVVISGIHTNVPEPATVGNVHSVGSRVDYTRSNILKSFNQ